MPYAAVDVGGTKIVGALFGDDGVSARIEAPTPVVEGRADPGAVETKRVAEALLRAAGGELEGVGVSVCEYVDAGRVDSREVLAWPPGQDWLEAAFGAAPVVVESDARCGARAEVVHGGLRGVATGYFVSWGTGISGCLVVDGQVVQGAHGRAIALGELVVDGIRLEGHSSGRAMSDRYRLETGTVIPGAREVLARAEQGDEVARMIVTSAGELLADALGAVIRLLDPGTIVLGGGLGSARTVAGDALRRRMALGPSAGGGVPTPVHSALGPDGPLIGAAWAAGWRGPLEHSAGRARP